MEKTLHEKLVAIQSELKAPKSQTNSFGKYKYRSCEDILEAVKPLLKQHNLVLILDDQMVEVGGRVYVKAIAQLFDACDPAGVNYSGAAFAREALEKKGMDEAQITGSASSYARKYALNGLFCIDDTKDADATNDHGKAKEVKQEPEFKAMRQDQFASIESLCKQLNEPTKKIWDKYGSPDTISVESAGKIINALLEKREASLKAPKA